MTPDRRVSERVYQEMRRRILSGAFRLRERLDVGRLADSLQASATPVREALFRLASERLIASEPGRGFFMTFWSEAELRALYEWRGLLGELMRAQGARPAKASGRRLAYPERVALLLAGEGAAVNPELKRAARNADDRLYAARKAEADVFDDVVQEFASVRAALSGRNAEAALAALRSYHSRRADGVRMIHERALIRALDRNGA